MSAPLRGTARSRPMPIAFALVVCAFLGSTPPVHAGGHRHKDGGLWGVYGLGPHLNMRGPGDCDLGYPYFTHPMTRGIPYYGPPPYLSGYQPGDPPGTFGAYTGAVPFPDYIAPSLGPQPGDRSADQLPAPSPRRLDSTRRSSATTR